MMSNDSDRPIEAPCPTLFPSMTIPTIDRREFLIGLAAGVAGASGCSSSVGDVETQTAPEAAAPDGSDTNCGSVDAGGLDTSVAGDGSADGSLLDGSRTDASTSDAPAEASIPQGAIIVAASDSDAASKSKASYVCDGTDDEVEVNKAIAQAAATGAGTVYLTAGTFECAGWIALQSLVTLMGAGQQGAESGGAPRGTTLHMPNPTTGVLLSDGGDNSRTQMKATDFMLTGQGRVLCTADRCILQNITCYKLGNDSPEAAAFVLGAKTAGGSLPKVLQNVDVLNCKAIDCDRWGFVGTGSDLVDTSAPADGTLKNVRLVNCQAINCGRYHHYKEDEGSVGWDVGFSLTETAHGDNIYFENCLAEGCWESGFHHEFYPNKTNIVYKNCVSRNNGQKVKTNSEGFLQGQAYWCAGFIVCNGVTLDGCVSESNWNGFFAVDGGFSILNCEDRGSTRAGVILGSEPVSRPCTIRNVKVLGSNWGDPSGLYGGGGGLWLLKAFTVALTLEGLTIDSGAGSSQPGEAIVFHGAATGGDNLTFKNVSISNLQKGFVFKSSTTGIPNLEKVCFSNVPNTGEDRCKVIVPC
jgi:hypothetical protein